MRGWGSGREGRNKAQVEVRCIECRDVEAEAEKMADMKAEAEVGDGIKCGDVEVEKKAKRKAEVEVAGFSNCRDAEAKAGSGSKSLITTEMSKLELKAVFKAVLWKRE